MRCKKEEFINNGFYHLYNRTIKPFLLFYDDEDYIWFLNRLEENLQKYPASVFAFCLMPNHFHFLLRQDSDMPVYKLLNHTISPYVRHLNHKLKRKGRLFETKLQHKGVKTDNYLLSLCQYIHSNPVSAKLVQEPEEWEFSNYHEWLETRTSTLFSNDIKTMFPDDYEIYSEHITNYKQNMNDKIFRDLLLEEDNL